MISISHSTSSWSHQKRQSVCTHPLFSGRSSEYCTQVYTGQPKAQYFFTDISICTCFCVFHFLSFSIFCLLLRYFHLKQSSTLPPSPERGEAIASPSRCGRSSPSGRKMLSVFFLFLLLSWHNVVVVLLNNRVETAALRRRCEGSDYSPTFVSISQAVLTTIRMEDNLLLYC